MRRLAFALLQAVLSGLLAGALVQPRGAHAASGLAMSSSATVTAKIAQYRRQTWHWQRVMGMRPTPTADSAPTDPSLHYGLWIERLWHDRAVRMRRLALHPPHLSQWLCIHRYEGSWGDSGGPYYGGLQMDISFQSHYGRDLLVRKGTADHWTPLEQMWVAERALRAGRSFYAWPNTARFCGII